MGKADHLPKPKKGERLPGAGRKLGTPNRATVELKTLLSTLVHDPEYQAGLIKRAKAGKLAPALELGIVHLVGGKPVDRQEVGKPGDFRVMTDDEIRSALAKLALKMDPPTQETNQDASQTAPAALSDVAVQEPDSDAGPGPDAVH